MSKSLLSFLGCLVAGLSLVGAVWPASALASDHLDTPSVIADPRADIGDLYAWTSQDGRRLNLVMTIVGHTFSDRLNYVFHIDSGRRMGRTTATIAIVCRFAGDKAVSCRVGDVDAAIGDPGGREGLGGRNGRFQVFAGLRDDPFFNNVRGTRAAYNTAAAALAAEARVDEAGCPGFDRDTSQAVLDQWRHTDGGPGTNFLAGWTPASLVVSVDLDVVTGGGPLLAVWAATEGSARQIDRAGRTLTGNALLGTLGTAEVSNALKENYNAATPATAAKFIPEIETGLALYDGFDGACGNQLMARPDAWPALRYRALATMLADDRLWVNSASTNCTRLFAVEMAAMPGHEALASDCGGRTPLYSAVNVYRSLLVNGHVDSVDDGVNADDQAHSATVFPFLAPVAPAPTDAKPSY